MTELLRVSHVEIKGLFNIYNHEFDLKSNERVTILHGPNGVGKTLLLKGISSLFNGNYSFLRRTPFREFTVGLSDGSRITIARETTGRKEKSRGRNSLGVELTAEIRVAGTKQVIAVKPSADVEGIARLIERHSPFIMEAGPNRWIDRRENRVYTSEELVEANNDELMSGRFESVRAAEPEPLQAFRKRVRVSLIETDRLSASHLPAQVTFDSPPSGRPLRAVSNYAMQLQKRIESTLAQYGRSSQQLDQSFPQRLIQEDVPELGLQELKRRMETLEERQRELSEIGLLDKIPSRPFDPDSLDSADKSKLGPMTLYLLDSEKKVAAFDDVATRLKLLVNSARAKFKNKRLSVNRETGLFVTGAQGERIDIEGLSSGEQHEIVLMYELLFKTPPNSLILIDEPELSLHVTWQRLFLPEIQAVAKQVGFDVVLATHSPFIVGGRTDLLIGLDMNRDDMPLVEA